MDAFHISFSNTIIALLLILECHLEDDALRYWNTGRTGTVGLVDYFIDLLTWKKH
jgi:hypothetical protein